MKNASKLYALAALLISALAAAQASVPFTEKDLVGTWDDNTCAPVALIGPNRAEAQPSPVHFKRTYTLTEAAFAAQYSFFGDAGCQKPLFVIRYGGRAKLGPAVKGLPATREGDFSFDTIHLTIADSTLLGGARDCGSGTWEVGVQQNVAGTGCKAFNIAPSSVYPTDHDIITLQGNRINYGFRTPNMGTPAGRPTTLQDSRIAAVKR